MNMSAQLSDQGIPSESPATVAVDGVPGDLLFHCLAWIARHHGDDRSVAAWRQGVPRDGRSGAPQAMIRAAEQAGYVATLVQRPLADLPQYVLPAIVLLLDGKAAVLVQKHADGTVDAAMPESAEGLLPVRMHLDQLAQGSNGYCILIKPPIRVDERAGRSEPSAVQHWFWGTLWNYRSYYANIALAALMINVLVLAGVFFTMNVYDRVVPTQAYPTLWTLAIGTALAMLFEFATRQMRSHLVDVAGKKIDLVLGAKLFKQTLGVRLESRPTSSGSFANQLREFESLREFTTSATVSALTDLPFAMLFLAVIVAIGGPLAWVPGLAVPLVVLVGVLIQWPLGRYMRENLREASLKHGLLIESLEGIETLKAVNGQYRMQKSWEDYSAVAAASSMKSRMLSSLALNFVSFVQQLETVILVVWGVYLIHEGAMSQGALIGVVMLARQVVSPLAQVVGLAVRFQQAKASLESLNKLMAQPTDRDDQQRYLNRARFEGDLRTENLQFCYPQQKLPSLDSMSLQIKAGERVAILGRIGSGKSTLLRLLSGLYMPTQGSVYADGIDLRQLDAADIHQNIGLVTQDCKLFYGTLRDNLILGAPHASAEQIMGVCRTTGLDTLVSRHPQGLDMMLGEGGDGLSGGQRQLVALARCLLANPPVLLMDEPTSAMDAQTESAFMAHLKKSTEGRTLVIATHRLSLLELVDRVIVLEQGRVMADGPKKQLLQALTAGAGVPVTMNRPGAKHG
jgi:ATP-binding cassette, subfamily C, bacterial LapB